MTIENDVFDLLETTLSGSLPWVKKVIKEKPITDLAVLGSEVPLVQFFWDPSQSVQQQQRGKTVTRAPLIIEVVSKDTRNLDMTQTLLFQYRSDVLAAVASIINGPGVQGFVHFEYNGRVYDIHSVSGFYIARLRFTALYQESYGSC